MAAPPAYPHGLSAMSSSLTTTIPDVGLTQVFTTPDPLVDIVFVHGLNGNPYKTWTADNGVFWPRDLLPSHLPDLRFRILTYGYDARVSAFTDGVGKDHIHHHAENLAGRLYTNRSVSSRCTTSVDASNPTSCQSTKATERPIIFVVHSLGGLVTKQCLIYSRSIDHPNAEHLRSIFVSTYGILFMGTPHLGSDLAKWGTLLQSIASAALPRRFFDSSSHLVEALKTNNETLQNINRQFNEIMPKLRIYLFYEGKPMDLRSTRQFVVDEASAAPDWPGAERMVIERDHSHMCKFEDENTTGFNVVAEALTRYSNDAVAVIAVRWDEEKQVRAFQRQMAAREQLLPGQQRQSRGTSPDSRTDSRAAPTPLLAGSQTPLLVENTRPSDPTVTPWEVEEHEADVSRQPSTSASMSASIPRIVQPSLLVAPVGFRPNTRYVGFDIEMARLVAKLADERRSRIGVQSALLYGPPGCGKTHLAREYLWRHFDEYPNGVFWIDCKTIETRNKSMWDVALALNRADQPPGAPPDSFVDAVRKHLAHLDKWLMVFDGISFENESQLADFVRYIPDGRGSSIIYTTVDKTLSNRQWLLNPAGIKVYPLSVDQACTLLFRYLHIRQNEASSIQKKRAGQLVRHYDCLPLGIHAAAHMLLNSNRPFEKYTPAPSDNRLASPFLAILTSLQKARQTETVNLLRIMCFLNHEVPVGLLQFGHNSLLESGVEIRSVNSNGGSGRRELDNSIALLIKNGLIERRLQTNSAGTSSGGRSSPEETRPQSVKSRHDSIPSPDKDDGDEDSQHSSATFIGIDVIRVHTVVQQVFLDYLRAQSPERYNSWLAVTARFLIAAWTFAHRRIQANAGRGLVSDYREFENHVVKVYSHFPTRLENTPQYLRQARSDLHTIRRIIRREIESHSPSQSFTSGPRKSFVSIFERSGSSSDEGPETPTSGLTRMSTWSNEPDVNSTESPVDYRRPAFPELPPSLGASWHDDDVGYMSDTEGRPNLSKQRTTSNSTEKAPDERHMALRSIFGGKNAGENGSWRPVPVVGTSVAEIQPIHSRSNSNLSTLPIRPSSTTSLAEAALSGIYGRSPPSSKGGSGSGTSSYRDSNRRPLSELSSNTPMVSSYSDRGFDRHSSSTSPHLVQAVLANTMRRDPLPIDENISITRRSQPVVIGGGGYAGRPTTWKPSLPTLESHSLPAERGPISVAMARDLSHESTTSVQTEPAIAELEGNNSISDEYLTPLMSPVDPRQSPGSDDSRGRRGLPTIETSMSSSTRPVQGLPYPIPSSPDTQPMPVLVSRSRGTSASGSGSGIRQGQGQGQDVEKAH